MSNFKIRAHHGLCVKHFIGKGYNDAFSKNMYSVVESLKENPIVEIVCGKDIICDCCPNLSGQKCKSYFKTAEYDKKVFDLCNINPNDKFSWNDYQNIIEDKIIKSNMLYFICGDCEWFYICNSNYYLK